MEAVREDLAHWGLDGRAVRQRRYAAPTPRERWHARWLLNLGWTNGRSAEALERDAYTIDAWLADFRGAGPAALRHPAATQRLPDLPASAGLRAQAPKEVRVAGGRGEARVERWPGSLFTDESRTSWTDQGAAA